MKIKGVILLFSCTLLLAACSGNANEKQTYRENEESAESTLIETETNVEPMNKVQNTDEQLEEQSNSQIEIESSEKDDNLTQSYEDKDSNIESEDTDTGHTETLNDGLMVSNFDDIELTKYNKVEELILSEETSAHFIMTSNNILKNMKIYSVSYDGVQLEILETLYTSESFSPDIALDISAYIPPYFSNLMISIEKSPDNYARYFIIADMQDEIGNVSLEKVPDEL